jgi:hypothetical protein
VSGTARIVSTSLREVALWVVFGSGIVVFTVPGEQPEARRREENLGGQ